MRNQIQIVNLLTTIAFAISKLAALYFAIQWYLVPIFPVLANLTSTQLWTIYFFYDLLKINYTIYQVEEEKFETVKEELEDAVLNLISKPLSPWLLVWLIEFILWLNS